MRPAIVLIVLVVAGACAPPSLVRIAKTDAWPDDWEAAVGKVVTLEGRAANAFLGAELLGDGAAVWIDGMDRWPEELMRGEAIGVRIRVTGKVIRRDDVPVVTEPTSHGVPVHGVPVKSEEEAGKARRRYLLAEAKWTLL